MKATIFNFTKKSVEALPLFNINSETKYIKAKYRDSNNKYLYLYVSKRQKTFYFYKSVNGRPREIQIGVFPAISVSSARTKVSGYNTSFAEGIDPVEAKKQKKQKELQELSLKDLFDLYTADRGKKKRSIGTDIRQFNKYLKHFHNTKISEINKANIRILHNNMGSTPYQANRCLALLSTLFNHAKHTLEINVDNPCVGIKKYKEHARDRILNEDELHRYRNTCTKWAMRPDKALYSDIFMMLLYSGQRKTNVLSMKFSDIDFFSNNWTIPAAEFKNDELHKIPLVVEAVAILQRRFQKLKGKSNFVFPSPTYPDRAIVEIKWQWKLFLQEAGITDLTRHDMRRTAGSIILMMTGNLKLVQKFLGHKDIATTAKVYSHLWEDKMTEAIEGAFKNITANSGVSADKLAALNK